MSSNTPRVSSLTARWRAAAQRDSQPPVAPAEIEPSMVFELANLRDLSVVGLFILAAVTALFFAQPIVVPVIAAIVVGSIFAPLAARLAQRGVPMSVTALGVVGLIALSIYFLSVAMAAPISQFIADMPRALSQLREKLQGLDSLRRNVSEIQAVVAGSASAPAAAPVAAAGDVSSTKMVEATVSIVTPALTQLVIFMGSLLFFLWSRTGIRRHIVLALSSRNARLVALRVMNDVESHLATYFATITLINIGLAVATAVGLTLLGIEGAVLWGVLAGIINYIPYVGPAVVTIVLLIVGMTTQPTLLTGLLPAGMFIALTTIEGQFLSPAIIGRRLAMNPFLVFLGVVFWTWLWGPIGAFLAVPLLIIWTVASNHLSPEDDVDLPG